MQQALRWFEGKKILSTIRDGDYAHPGEEDAITLTLSKYTHDKNRQILDVGCGLGGTAYFIQNYSLGKVTGIDIEPNSIKYAQEKYKNIEFYVSDVVNVHKIFKRNQFDLFCFFNSFYAFKDQLQALKSLREIAHNNSQLVIFEYLDLTIDGKNSLRNNSETNDVFIPVRAKNIENILNSANWNISEMINITDKYEYWYKNFLTRIINKKNLLTEKFGEVAYENVYSRYSAMYDSIKNGTLGGCIIHASAMPILN